MNMIQMLFTKFADILLTSRAYPFLQCQPLIQNQTKEIGIIWNKEINFNVQQLLQNNWRSAQTNEMIVQFFLEKDGNSFLVEEWSLIQSQSIMLNMLTAKKNNSLLKQITIWLRSAIAMMTMTTIFQEELITKQYKVTHSLLFYNRNTKKRSDWIDDSKLQVKKISTKFLSQLNFQLTIAQQGQLQHVLSIQKQKINQSPLFKRCRYLSEQIDIRDPQLIERKMTMDAEYQVQLRQENPPRMSLNNLNLSFVSIYSKKEEVELLFTPEEAAQKLKDKTFLEEDYEINLMTGDPTTNKLNLSNHGQQLDNKSQLLLLPVCIQNELLISQIMVSQKLSNEDKINQSIILDTLKDIQQASKNRRIRSIQINRLLSFYRQMC
ncbi:unnamed protein product (macronuclear) [Paramecium tetraurelia]|uniref:HORMA domain-containing protein n=1 Tax=Paramecium tetraurelia TaxID=5888 RepID=A0DHK1_PARTE|nr:uncharacterized protein GSPATT00016905001 [Paramecium tetraurelia]CAK82518.1 unnamed protein product [Paramecium tetraurelia]|eukprot:XP_001449915.1 hypothetical protein (macronuclear) [Paramecium tetraurelia strain d4-2]